MQVGRQEHGKNSLFVQGTALLYLVNVFRGQLLKGSIRSHTEHRLWS